MRKAKILKTKIVEFILFIVYKLLYIFYIYNYFEIYDHSLDTSSYKFFVGWIVYVIIVLIALKQLKDIYFSSIFKFLFIISGVSSITIFELSNISYINFVLVVVYWFLLLMAFIYYQNRGYNSNVKASYSPKLKNLQNYILAFSFAFAIIMSGIYSNFRFTLSFDEVYVYRLELRANKMPLLISYLFFFIGGATLPYCFSYFISKKSYFLAIISLLGGIIIFSVNGMKTWLIVYPLIMGVFVTFKINNSKITSYILLAMSIWIILGVNSYNKSEDLQQMALFSRTTFIPAKIGYNYLDFYSENHYLYLSESVLRFFIDSPYPVNSQFYIVDGSNSDVLTSSRANNGLWGDAFANFSYLGILIYPFILGYVFYMFKRSMLNQDNRLLISMAFFLCWSAINTSFFTWLLTGGVLLLYLINIYSSDQKDNIIFT